MKMKTNVSRANANVPAKAAISDWQFYGLNGDGFRLTPDADFHFEHRGFLAAAAAVDRGLARGEGFVVLTGPPGSGKTTLAEKLLSQQHRAGKVCGKVTSTQVGADDLLRLIAFAFGLKMEQTSKAALLASIEQHLVRHARKARPAILLVDEAQNLVSRALEELRLLTNLAADNEPLLQILLFGQSELWQRLQAPENDQLRERVILSHQMLPLDAAESREYIAYRLDRVGWAGQPRISGQALQLIHTYTSGIPRGINRFMSHLMWLGISERTCTLDVDEVKQVIAQLASANLQPTAVSLTDSPGLCTSTPILKPLDAIAALEYAANSGHRESPAAEAKTAQPVPAAVRPRTSGRVRATTPSGKRSRLPARQGFRQFYLRSAQHVHTATHGLLEGLVRFGNKALGKSDSSGRKQVRPPLGTALLPRLAARFRGLSQRFHSLEWDGSMALTAVTTVITLGIVATGIVALQGETTEPRTTSPQIPSGQQRVQQAIALSKPEVRSTEPNLEMKVPTPSLVEPDADRQPTQLVAERSQPHNDSVIPSDKDVAVPAEPVPAESATAESASGGFCQLGR